MVFLATSPTTDSVEESRPLVERIRGVLISGAAVTIPILVTAIVLTFVVNFILGLISPLVSVVQQTFGVGQNLSDLALEGLAILTLVVVVFVVGVVAETRSGDGLERAFDTAMARIPGVGSVYTSFNEMSELLLSNDTQSFQEVKLVEFPTTGTYTVAFVTADTPDLVGEATGHEEMTTLFMPLAPNPVMGGFVLHVSEDRVHDVDLSVEEGIRSIVTSGVATGESDAPETDGDLVDLETIRAHARNGVAELENWGVRAADDLSDLRSVGVDDLEELGDGARREIVRVYPSDRTPEDDDPSPRHYMLTRSADEDESADQDSSVTRDDVRDDRDGSVTRDDDGPTRQDGPDTGDDT